MEIDLLHPRRRRGRSSARGTPQGHLRAAAGILLQLGSASLYGTARDSRGYLAYSIHNTPSLCWFLEEPFGFHFVYDSAEGARQLTYDGSGTQPRVKHYLGGNPIYLPRGCFVSKDLAWEVVQEFLRTQQFSAIVKWISSGEFEALGIDESDPN